MGREGICMRKMMNFFMRSFIIQTLEAKAFHFFLHGRVVSCSRARMASAGSITPRRGYSLKMGRNTGLIFIILTVVLVHHASTLRTGSISRGRSTDNEDYSTRSRSSISFAHTPSKERRLSFLNHQLSILGGKVGPELRIMSKIYSHRVDSERGTDEISVVEASQNSDLVVGKDLPKGTRLVLECQAEFPVNWIYRGDGVK